MGPRAVELMSSRGGYSESASTLETRPVQRVQQQQQQLQQQQQRRQQQQQQQRRQQPGRTSGDRLSSLTAAESERRDDARAGRAVFEDVEEEPPVALTLAEAAPVACDPRRQDYESDREDDCRFGIVRAASEADDAFFIMADPRASASPSAVDAVATPLADSTDVVLAISSGSENPFTATGATISGTTGSGSENPSATATVACSSESENPFAATGTMITRTSGSDNPSAAAGASIACSSGTVENPFATAIGGTSGSENPFTARISGSVNPFAATGAAVAHARESDNPFAATAARASESGNPFAGDTYDPSSPTRGSLVLAASQPKPQSRMDDDVLYL